MITKYLPKFKVVEVNNLTGLRNGHMLSQFAADEALATTINGNKFIENGVIVSLSKDGKIVPYAEGTMFVHYTEELNTFIDELQYFAVPVEGDTYIRCIALYTGDTFTTNNVVDGEGNYGKVLNGKINIVNSAEGAAFIVKKSTLPTGDEAYECTYVG
jgi:hypothetical protein